MESKIRKSVYRYWFCRKRQRVMLIIVLWLHMILSGKLLAVLKQSSQINNCGVCAGNVRTHD